jgi:predicted nucleotidyltransferase component of viral defense system
MEDKTNLKELCESISLKTNFPSLLLEKDYYLTKVLIALSKQDLGIIFKGGTCLNKCYLGFYRLSEDLDLKLKQEK